MDRRKRYQQTPLYKEARRQRRQRNRAMVQAVKSRPCADCGETFDPVCMDLDHRPGEIKLFDMAQIGHKSVTQLQKEIAKCDVVCANCHRVRTHRLRDHRATVMRGIARSRGE